MGLMEWEVEVNVAMYSRHAKVGENGFNGYE